MHPFIFLDVIMEPFHIFNRLLYEFIHIGGTINDYENNLVTENTQSEFKEDISSALNKLSEKERELIIRRYLDDKSLKDISSKTSVPLGTVKSRLSRTLIKLRGYMKEA